MKKININFNANPYSIFIENNLSSKLEKMINNLGTYDDVFIIYCSGGECSLSLDLADVFFSDKAFENVFVFEGGLPAWQDAGYPTE